MNKNFIILLTMILVMSSVALAGGLPVVDTKPVAVEDLYADKYQEINTKYINFSLPKSATHYWNPSGLDTYELIVNNVSIVSNKPVSFKFTWSDKRYINEMVQFHYTIKGNVLDAVSISPVTLNTYDKSCLDSLMTVKFKTKDDCTKPLGKTSLTFKDLKIEISTDTTRKVFQDYDFDCLTWLMETNDTCVEKNLSRCDTDGLSKDYCLINVTVPVYDWKPFESLTLKDLPEKDFLAIDDVAVSACGAITSAGTYVLNQSIINYTGGTCFNITASNVILDGNGTSITGDSQGNDYGIVANIANNVTIKNFGDIGGWIRGIMFVESNNSLIYNNSMNSTYDQTTYAVWLEDSNATTVYRNNIRWNSTNTSKDASGIYFLITGGNIRGYYNFSENNIFINSTSFRGVGIGSYTTNGIRSISFGNSYISSNNINLSCSSTCEGIRLPLAANITGLNVDNNNINLTSYNNLGTGIDFSFGSLSYANNINLTGNIINVNSSYNARGIYSITSRTVPGNPNNIMYFNVDNNTINLNNFAGGEVYAILASATSSGGGFGYTSITNNIVNANVSANILYGIYMGSNGQYNATLIQHNILNLYNYNTSAIYRAASGFAIRPLSANSSNVTIISNTFNILSYSFSYGIEILDSYTANSFVANNILNVTSLNNISTGILSSGILGNLINNSIIVKGLSIPDAVALHYTGTIGNLTYNNSYGAIKWVLPNSSVSYLNATRNLSWPDGNIKISNNSATYLAYGASATDALNSSANVTLYGMDSFGLVTPTIMKDGAPCGSACYNFTPLNAATVIFNVSSFSTYNISEPIPELVPPILSFTKPTNNTNYTYKSITLNYTYVELNPGTCWWTNNSGLRNNTISCGTSITQTWDEGYNTVFLYMNDTWSNVNYTNVVFMVDTIIPKVFITAPANNSVFPYKAIDINYTWTETNPRNCWWTNNSGTTNTSVSCTSNITGKTWAEGRTQLFVYVNDTSGNINYTFINFTSDTTGPNSTFYSQNPSDLNLTNFIGPTGVNMTYNITDLTGLSNSSIKLYYKSNSTQDNIHFYQNGTAFQGYFSASYIYNNSGRSYAWILYDNQVLPGSYNYGEITLENTLHSASNLTNQQSYASVELLNVSNNKTYSFFEIMANRSSGTGGLRFYYCNSSYAFNANPIGTTNCINFYTLTNGTYNHCHSNYSCHVVAPFTVNTTTRSVGTVNVTNTSYFLIRGATGSVWSFYHIPNLTGRSNAFKTSSNNGLTWTNQSTNYTIDAHLHQFGTNTSLWYYACANDSMNNQNCTTPRRDIFELGGLPPTSPDIYSPSEWYYKGSISINYTASESPNGYNISFYNITLFNVSNYAINYTLKSNNSLNISYVWDSTGTADGQYFVRVTVTDSLGQSSLGESANFTLDNTLPLIYVSEPLNNSNYPYNSIDLNYTWVELYADTCWWTNDSGVTNNTIACTSNITGYTWDEGYNTVFLYMNDSAGNVNQTNVKFFVDSVYPLLSITSPANETNFTYLSVSINHTWTEANPLTCWWTNDSGVTNTTLSCTSNITGTWIEGNNTIILYINDTVGNTNYTSVFFRISLPVSETSVSGGGGSSGGGTGGQQEYVKETSTAGLSSCGETEWIDKLLSTCKVPDNQICDNGEYLFIDDDCNLKPTDFSKGDILKYMWFQKIAVVFALSVFLRRPKKLP